MPTNPVSHVTRKFAAIAFAATALAIAAVLAMETPIQAQAASGPAAQSVPTPEADPAAGFAGPVALISALSPEPAPVPTPVLAATPAPDRQAVAVVTETPLVGLMAVACVLALSVLCGVCRRAMQLPKLSFAR